MPPLLNEVEKGAKTALTNIKTYFVTDTTADKGITGFCRVQKMPNHRMFCVLLGWAWVISEKNKESYPFRLCNPSGRTG